MDRLHILDAILDAQRELEEEPLASFVSQGVIDKLTSAQEILEHEEQDDDEGHPRDSGQPRAPGV